MDSSLALSQQDLYKLIVKTLKADGHEDIAKAVASAGGLKEEQVDGPVSSENEPSSSSSSYAIENFKLMDLVHAGIEVGMAPSIYSSSPLPGLTKSELDISSSFAASASSNPAFSSANHANDGRLEHDSASDAQMAEPADQSDFSSSTSIIPRPVSSSEGSYVMRFVSAHKGPCRVAKFSPDGKYVITASQDTSMKLLDVERMHLAGAANGSERDRERDRRKMRTGGDGDDMIPMMATGAEIQAARSSAIAKTFYDFHASQINDVDFHPVQPVVMSCSSDCTIRFADLSKLHTRRQRVMQESGAVRSAHFLPGSGDFFLCVVSSDPVIRLYDYQTLNCYTSVTSEGLPSAPSNMVRFSVQGDRFASVGRDGAIRIWDTQTFQLLYSIPGAHRGEEVFSVQFSRDGKFLLTNGADSDMKMWSAESGAPVRTFPSVSSYSGRRRATPSFNFTEQLIIGMDDNQVLLYDVGSAQVVEKLQGHTQVVRHIAVSPTEDSFVSCSDDARARFYAWQDIGSASIN